MKFLAIKFQKQNKGVHEDLAASFLATAAHRFAFLAVARYRRRVITSLFVEPCLRTISRTVPTGPQWAYEIKHDGFRFICRRDGDRVRVFSRNGHDWSKRLPSIVEAMQALPVTSVAIDGEGVICGPDGRSDFDARAVFGRQGSREAFLYAFDLLEPDGRDPDCGY